MGEVILRTGSAGAILTVDAAFSVVSGDVHCVDGRIVQVGGQATPRSRDYAILDAEGGVIMPGLVQTHLHTCQTLARGRGDDLALLDGLRQVVWPYEAAMSRDDVGASARLAAVELLLGGTTAIQDMGTVRHTDAIFEVLEQSGLRARAGKAMMDMGQGVPTGLLEETRASLAESHALAADWQGAAGGRLGYAYAPRFVLSCSEGLLREVAAAAPACGARVHTHASENADEVAAVRRERGADNIVYLHQLGLTGPHVGVAHGVWLSSEEQRILAETGTHVLHCPSSNLKLGSGIALIPELLAQGISVSLGADGAPCNNDLDGFLELRLAAILHRPRAGVKALPAAQALRLATMGGARALGLEDEIGSLEVGKRADVIVVDLSGAHLAPTASPTSAVVFAARASDVRHVVVDGQIVVQERQLLTLDGQRAIAEARARAHSLFARL
jgi:cytosine/adenosine deaminase-related metal-dependent hydrolase